MSPKTIVEATGEIISGEDAILHAEGVITVDDEVRESNPLRWVADSYDQVQRVRMAMDNRLRAYAQGRDDSELKLQGPAAVVAENLAATEKQLAKMMNELVKTHPAWPWLSQVRGVSGVLGCKLLGLLDINQARHISSFWKFCGLAVVNGERDRLQKGEKAPYSKRAKVVCYLIATSFLRSNSPFRKVYDDARVYYAANRPDWTPGHQHNAAMRKMEKVFLACLWLAWREALGLPTELPYAHERMGHEQMYRPEDFI